MKFVDDDQGGGVPEREYHEIGGADHAQHEEGHSMSSFQYGLLLVSVGLFLGALTRFIQTKWRKVSALPYTVVLLLIGLLLGAIEDKLGMLSESVASVKSIDPHLLLGAFIPALIFESAFSVNFHVECIRTSSVVSN